MRSRLALLLLLCPALSFAQEEYGAKGIFPVYETAGQWVIFDKKPNKEKPTPLGRGERFLVVGSAGAEVFEVKRASGTYGGMCRGRKPLKLRAGLLVGPRRVVGRPIIGIHVPKTFSLKGSRAVYKSLTSEVRDERYVELGEALKTSALKDIGEGKFKLREGEAPPNPTADAIQLKLDFGAAVTVDGVRDAFIFVEESALGASTRRCLRLASGKDLVGGCAEMPRALMAETPLLQFVSYDPSGRGNPFVLAFTKTTPLWGDERWAFAVRHTGPRLFLMDATDPRCRESF